MSSCQNKIVLLNHGQNKEISINKAQFTLLQKHSSVIECCIDNNTIYLHNDIDMGIFYKIIVLLENIEKSELLETELSKITKKDLFCIANMCFYLNIQVLQDIICTKIAKEIQYFNEIELENYFRNSQGQM